MFLSTNCEISLQLSSVTQLCPTLCEPMNRSTPGFPAHHQLPEFSQTHVHQVSDAIQPSHPLSSPSPPAFFIVQLSHPYMNTGKAIALTRWTFLGKVMSLFLNMLARLVIAFLPRSKCLLISWLQSPSAVKAQENKVSHCFHCFPAYLP